MVPLWTQGEVGAAGVRREGEAAGERGKTPGGWTHVQQAGGHRVKRVTSQQCHGCRAGRGRCDVVTGSLWGPQWCDGAAGDAGAREGQGEPAMNVMGVSWTREGERRAGDT